jgi:hypothetical protein
MPQDPNAHFDQTVLDLIEHSPIGAVPFTPTYQDALKRLYASHQAYPHADHKNGHVTARSLAKLPHFQAKNLEDLLAGRIAADALEANGSIFNRYVQSLPEAVRARAETFRLSVAGKVAHHRAKHVGDEKIVVAHDPIHTLFLVPGTGPHTGLPGNYLHGAAVQLRATADSPWSVHVHDSDDGDALFESATMAEALAKTVEVLECAPFNMNELEALGFTLK